jgi:RNA polymerase sigma-70 factor, ECF subfamily
MTMPLPEPTPEAPAGHPLQVAPASTDAELVARVHRGDGLAFELIMRRRNRRLFRLARSFLRDDAEAEDVLQEAYMRAYARLGGLTDPQALPAWLARIVANEALGRLRAAAHVVLLEEHRTRSHGEGENGPVDDPASDQSDPERLAASGELRRLLEAAVDALPEEFRAVFVLREVEGLSTAEAAACLALRPETVKTRLHRARRLLQEALGGRLLALSPSLFEFGGGRCDRVVARVFQRLGRGESSCEAASSAVPLPAEPPAPAAPGRRRWFGRLLAHLERRGRR